MNWLLGLVGAVLGAGLGEDANVLGLVLGSLVMYLVVLGKCAVSPRPTAGLARRDLMAEACASARCVRRTATATDEWPRTNACCSTAWLRARGAGNECVTVPDGRDASTSSTPLPAHRAVDPLSRYAIHSTANAHPATSGRRLGDAWSRRESVVHRGHVPVKIGRAGVYFASRCPARSVAQVIFTCRSSSAGGNRCRGVVGLGGCCASARVAPLRTQRAGGASACCCCRIRGVGVSLLPPCGISCLVLVAGSASCRWCSGTFRWQCGLLGGYVAPV